MPKYQVNIEETQNYLILVEAEDEEKAEEIASQYVGDGGVDYADGRSEVYEVLAVPEDTPGPFPRADEDNEHRETSDITYK